jgi:nucleotide-binding universal stress UspA family protein
MDVVVVGVEDTEEAKDALRFARMLADAEEAELHVVSVHTETVFYEGREAMETIREMYFARMSEFAREEVGEPFSYHRIYETSASRGLTEVAEKVGAGIIVIGSSHRGPIGRVLMGDAGARLAAGAPCSVAVTPRGWASNAPDRIRKIGIGYDDTSEAKAALGYGGELANKLDASVLILGVIPASVRPGRGGFSDLAYWNLLRDDLDKELAGAVERVGVENATGKVFAGYAPDELARASTDLDLLVLGSRSYGPIRRVLLGSTSVRVMRSSACPVVVVPRVGD